LEYINKKRYYGKQVKIKGDVKLHLPGELQLTNWRADLNSNVRHQFQSGIHVGKQQ